MTRKEAVKIVDSRKTLNEGSLNYWREKNIQKLMKFDPNKTAIENSVAIGFSNLNSFFNFAQNMNLNFKKIKKAPLNIDKWNPELSIKENAINLKISYSRAMQYALKNNLSYIRHKEARLKRLLKLEVIEYLLKKNFKITDIARLFQVSKQYIDQTRSKYFDEIAENKKTRS